MAELLLAKGYDVHGLVRRTAVVTPGVRLARLASCVDRITLHAASLENYASVFSVVERVRPDECYHFAAQSYVADSFEDAFTTMTANITGTHHVLAAVQAVAPKCRVFYAGSSEMFGNADEVPQKETTRLHPRSPYGISKVAGFHLTSNFREAFGTFACSAIAFNHESPRRGPEFVTRKISSTVARIVAKKQERLVLGNLDAQRDWGHARDYVEAMWLMLQQQSPDDYVIATGETHSVREFADLAFATVGLDSKAYVDVSEAYFRPAEINALRGDASKAEKVLGWKPRSRFRELVREMVTADCEALGVGSAVVGE